MHWSSCCAAAAAAAAAMAGCGDCNTRPEPAVAVAVQPLPPGAELGRAFGWIRDGGYLDSLRVTDFLRTPGGDPEGVVLTAGWVRPGLYEVTVAVPGFAGWDTAGVNVGRDGCDKPVTAELALLLQPGS